MENVAEKQHGLLELLRIRLNPAIEDLGYELYDLEDLQYQGQRILRVSIDHEQGIQLEAVSYTHLTLPTTPYV